MDSIFSSSIGSIALILLSVMAGAIVRHLYAHFKLKAELKKTGLPVLSQILTRSVIRIPYLADVFYMGCTKHLLKKFLDIAKQQKQNGNNRKLAFQLTGTKVQLVAFGVNELREVFLKKQQLIKSEEIYHSLAMYGPNILTLAGGQTHRVHRQIMDPAFSINHLRYLVSVTGKAMHQILLPLWEQRCAENSGGNKSFIFEPAADLIDVTLQIIGFAGFGVDLEEMHQQSKKLGGSKGRKFSFKEAIEITTGPAIIWKSFLKGNMWPLATRFVPFFRDIQRGIDEAGQYVDEILVRDRAVFHQASAEGDQHNDLVSLMLRANEEADKNGNQKMTDLELKSNAWVAIGAGHETTSTSLQWTLFELAKNMHVQDRLYEEVMKALDGKAKDADFSFEDYDKLQYVLYTQMESLRLHAPVFAVNKTLEKDDMVCGVPLRKGDWIWANIQVTQLDPDNWGEDAAVFRPERFSEKYDPLAWIPFSFASRKCIGWQFSLYESVIILAMLVREYTFHLACDPASVTIVERVTMRPGNLRLEVRKRSK